MEIGFRLHRAGAQYRPAPSLVALLLIGLLAPVPLLFPCPAAAQQAPASSADKDKSRSAVPPAAATPPVITEDNEVRLGRENAEENDKQVKLVTDAALVERVNRIGQEIAAVANKTPVEALWGSSQLKPFHYSFKIVDDKDVNAYSLPGGFIYVNKGLLDYVRSDDELAGVLAHEVSHAAHHHMVKLLREQGKIDRAMLPLKLLAMGLLVAGRGGNAEAAQHLFLGTQLYSIARVNSYGVEAEKDADHSGMILLTHTHFNPVGLYSFMIREATDERNRAKADLGIFRTHPPGEERVEAAKQFLEEHNIPILLSAVDPTLRLVVTTVKGGGFQGTDLAEVRMREVLLCRVAGGDGQTAEQHARQVALRLNGLIDTQLQPFEIRVNKEQTRVAARGVSLLTDADAAAQSKSLADLAREMSLAVTRINQRRQLDSGM